MAKEMKFSRVGKRRLTILVSIIIGLIVAISSIWLFVSWKVSDLVDQTIASQAEMGNDIDCNNRRTSGYPFRIGVWCDSLAASLEQGTVSFKAGELRTAAQIYDPGRVVGELDGPFTLISIDGDTVNGTWENARLSLKATLSGELERAAILVSEPQFDYKSSLPQIVGNFQANGESAGFYMRQSATPGSVDLAYRLTGVKLTLPAGAVLLQTGVNQSPVNLPPFNTTMITHLEDVKDLVMDGGDLVSHIQENGLSGILQEATLQPVEGGMLKLSGPYSVDGKGLVTGEFQLEFASLGKVIGFLASVNPQLADQLRGAAQIIEQFAKPVPKSADKATDDDNAAPLKGETTHAIAFKVNEGKIRFGLFQIGEIPPLF